jgi:hypothetical protein
MSKEVEISKIIIKIGKKEIKLSLEEARELQATLDDTLGTKETFIIPTYPVYPVVERIIERVVERPQCPPYRIIPMWEYHPNVWTVTAGTSVDSSGTITYSLSDGTSSDVESGVSFSW